MAFMPIFRATTARLAKTLTLERVLPNLNFPYMFGSFGVFRRSKMPIEARTFPFCSGIRCVGVLLRVLQPVVHFLLVDGTRPIRAVLANDQRDLRRKKPSASGCYLVGYKARAR